MVPLFFSAEYAAMRTVVKNYQWIPDQIPRFREVWIKVAMPASPAMAGEALVDATRT